MQLNKWIVLGASTFALVGVVGGAVVAKTIQSASEGLSDMRGMPFGGVFSPAVLRDLNLTAGQRQQIRQILRTDRASFVPLLANAHTSGKALRDAVSANASGGDLQTLAGKQADADLAVIVAAQNAQSQIAGVLTAKQRSQAQAAIDTRLADVRDKISDGTTIGAVALEKLGDRLGLTADQKAQAKQILAASRSANQTAALALVDTLKSAEDSIAAGTFDSAASAAETQQAQQPLTTVVLNASQTRAELLALLTPAQKAQLKQIMSARREQFRSRVHQAG